MNILVQYFVYANISLDKCWALELLAGSESMCIFNFDVYSTYCFTSLLVKHKECLLMGFSGDSVGKESVYNSGHLGSIPGLGRSAGGGHGNPLQYSCLQNPHGQRNRAGYSPWGDKESDTTGPLIVHTPYQWSVINLKFFSNWTSEK